MTCQHIAFAQVSDMRGCSILIAGFLLCDAYLLLSFLFRWR